MATKTKLHFVTLFIIIGVLTLAIFSLIGCTPRNIQSPLVVLEWTGYEPPEYWKEFAEKHPDVKVNHVFFADDPEAFTKIQSGFEADLVHPNTSWLRLYVENDLLQPVDTSRLSNWKDISPDLAKLGQMDGKQYIIPWEWGYTSVTVRTDKVKEIPKSYTDLWNPEYKGHVSIYDSAENAIVMTALSLGFDPWKMNDEQLSKVKQKLIELKPNLLGYWSDYTEINQQISSGEVWLAANTWQDAYLTPKKEGITTLEYIEPKEGRIGWVYGYAIPKNAKNLDLAYDYLDAMISKDTMVQMANTFGYGASNVTYLPEVDPEIVKVMKLDQPNIIERTRFLEPLTKDQRQDWMTLWDEVKATQ